MTTTTSLRHITNAHEAVQRARRELGEVPDDSGTVLALVRQLGDITDELECLEPAVVAEAHLRRLDRFRRPTARPM